MTNDETSDAPAEIIEDEILGGRPRLEGHRIGVFYIWPQHRRERTIEDIAGEVYPHLRPGQVEAATEYADAHPERMAALERDRGAGLGNIDDAPGSENSSRSGGAVRRVKVGSLPAGTYALVSCPTCEERWVGKRLPSESP